MSFFKKAGLIAILLAIGLFVLKSIRIIMFIKPSFFIIGILIILAIVYWPSKKS